MAAAPGTNAGALTRAEVEGDGPVDVWILAGQSNTVGDNSRDGTAMPAASAPLPGRLLMYDAAGLWRDAAPNVHVGMYGVDHQDSCGPNMAFGRSLLALGLAARVGFVPTASGGTSLHDGRRGGELYGAMLRRSRGALVAALPGGAAR